MVEACNVEDSPDVSLCFGSCPSAGVVLSFEGPKRNGPSPKWAGGAPTPPPWSQLADVLGPVAQLVRAHA